MESTVLVSKSGEPQTQHILLLMVSYDIPQKHAMHMMWVKL